MKNLTPHDKEKVMQELVAKIGREAYDKFAAGFVTTPIRVAEADYGYDLFHELAGLCAIVHLTLEAQKQQLHDAILMGLDFRPIPDGFVNWEKLQFKQCSVISKDLIGKIMQQFHTLVFLLGVEGTLEELVKFHIESEKNEDA